MLSIIVRGVPVQKSLSLIIAEKINISANDKKSKFFSLLMILFTFPVFFVCHLSKQKKYAGKLLTFRKQLLGINIPSSQTLNFTRKVSVHFPMDVIAASTGDPGKYLDVTISGVTLDASFNDRVQGEVLSQTEKICKKFFSEKEVSVKFEKYNSKIIHSSKH